MSDSSLPILLATAPAALAVPALALGACMGSFLNVVAWRLPRNQSFVHPPSSCPRCGTRLRWHDNVPILGWLLLGGRCRHCHTAIPVRYPAVELLAAGLWVALLFARPEAMGSAPNPWLLVLAGWTLAAWLIPLVLVDLERMLLPEPLCRWGLITGLVATALLGALQGDGTARTLLFSHLLAAAAGLLGFEALSALGEKAMGRPALGLGDARLAALIGAWLGPLGLAVTVALAVFGGAVVGGLARLSGRLGPQQPFPFGPFLAAGALVVWIGGAQPWLVLSGLEPLLAPGV
jgi:leader peptidase (prepilin peptidase)/N-methyltransferase